ncbi:hypothetical protein JCM6882_005996 [Rhodosporidiobolus microsporus]
MSSLAVLGLLALTAFAGSSAAQTCPYGHTSINFSATTGQPQSPECCSTGFETDGDWSCAVQNFNGRYILGCWTSTSGTFTITPSAEWTQLIAYMNEAGTAEKGFSQRLFGLDPELAGSDTIKVSASAKTLTMSDYNCAKSYPSDQSFPVNGVDCRWMAGLEQDGSAYGQVFGGPFVYSQTINAPAMVYPARAGFSIYLPDQPACIERAAEPEPEEEEDEPIPAPEPESEPEEEPVEDQPGDDEDAPVEDVPEEDEPEEAEPVEDPVEEEPAVTQTTYAATQTVFATVFVSTVNTPSAILYVTPTSTVTSTPATSTVTETETKNVDLGPEYSTETIDGGVTTPATVTVSTSTDVTTTPQTSTVTATITPATSTTYQTQWATSTPPTKTITAVQTVYTGHADCTNFRLTFPEECCPSNYVKLRTLKRRALDFDLEKRAATVTVDGGVSTTTSTLSETATVGLGEITVTVDATTSTGAAATPLTTTTETKFVTLPRDQIVRTTVTYGQAPTPTSTVTSTVYHAAPTPIKNVTVTGAVPVTTVTRQSTTTLPQQTTTTTSTAYAQATTCAAKTVYSQDRCPSSNLVKNLVQDAQVAALNLYKALGGKRVIVDCGDAGVFTY